MKNFIPFSSWVKSLGELEALSEAVKYFKRLEIEQGSTAEHIENLITQWKTHLSLIRSGTISKSELSENLITCIQSFDTTRKNKIYEYAQHFFCELNRKKETETDFERLFEAFLEFVTKNKGYSQFSQFTAVAVILRIPVFASGLFFLLASDKFEQWPAWIQLMGGCIWLIPFLCLKKESFPIFRALILRAKHNIRDGYFMAVCIIACAGIFSYYTRYAVEQENLIPEFPVKILFYELFYICGLSGITAFFLKLKAVSAQKIYTSVPVNDIPGITIIVPANNTRRSRTFDELMRQPPNGRSIFYSLAMSYNTDFNRAVVEWAGKCPMFASRILGEPDKKMVSGWLNSDFFAKLAAEDKQLKTEIEAWCQKRMQSMKVFFSNADQIIMNLKNRAAIQEQGKNYGELSLRERGDIDTLIRKKLKILVLSNSGFYAEYESVLEKIRRQIPQCSDDEKTLLELAVLRSVRKGNFTVQSGFQVQDLAEQEAGHILSALGLRLFLDEKILINEWIEQEGRSGICQALGVTAQEIIGLNLSCDISEKEVFSEHADIIQLMESDEAEEFDISGFMQYIKTDTFMILHPYTAINSKDSDWLQALTMFRENKSLNAMMFPVYHQQTGIYADEWGYCELINDIMRTEFGKVSFSHGVPEAEYGIIYRTKSVLAPASSIFHYTSEPAYSSASDFSYCLVPGNFMMSASGKFYSCIAPWPLNILDISSEEDAENQIEKLFLNKKEISESLSYRRYLDSIPDFSQVFSSVLEYIRLLYWIFIVFLPLMTVFSGIYTDFSASESLFFLLHWLFVLVFPVLYRSDTRNSGEILRKILFSPGPAAASFLRYLLRNTGCKKYAVFFLTTAGMISCFSALCMLPRKTLFFEMSCIPVLHIVFSIVYQTVSSAARRWYLQYRRINIPASVAAVLVLAVIIQFPVLFVSHVPVHERNNMFIETLYREKNVITGILPSDFSGKSDTVSIMELALLSQLDKKWAKTIILPVMIKNCWDDWAPGFYHAISVSGKTAVKKEIDTETNVMAAMAFLKNNDKFRACQIADEVLLPYVDARFGGIVSGNASFCDSDGRRYDYIKNTRQNFIAWGMFHSLYTCTKMEKYKEACDNIRKFLVQMYVIDTGSFRRGAIFHNDSWIPEDDRYYSTSTSALSILSLGPNIAEHWFGAGSMDKILEHAGYRAGHLFNVNHMGTREVFLYDSTDIRTNYETANRKRTDFSESTILMAAACRIAGAYYSRLNLTEYSEKWVQHASMLKGNIRILLTGHAAVPDHFTESSDEMLYSTILFLLEDSGENPYCILQE